MTGDPDANGFVVDGDTAWLRVGPAYAFHTSADGRLWQFVRYFGLGTDAAEAGFEVQSPTGAGCAASFADATSDGEHVLTCEYTQTLLRSACQ